jgi:hypothetical protein
MILSFTGKAAPLLSYAPWVLPPATWTVKEEMEEEAGRVVENL